MDCLIDNQERITMIHKQKKMKTGAAARRRHLVGLVCLFIMAAFFAACEDTTQPPSGKIPMVLVKAEDVPDFWDDLKPESLFQALDQSRTYLSRLPASRSFQYGEDAYTASHLLNSLNTFEKYYRSFGPGKELNQAVHNDFLVYKSIGDDDKGRVLVTGYYEPELEGSLSPDEKFRWPLYGPPGDMIVVNLGEFLPALKGKSIVGRLADNRLIPYYTRRDIDRRGALDGRGLELAWVSDPVSLFFLHIQGSGRIRLPDGSILRMGYAGKNGRPYRSIGRYMLDNKLAEKKDMTMQGLRDWLRSHPARMAEVMDQNESYVFFRKLEGDPVGNINVPLTPERSVALDYRIFPKGALAWLESRLPILAGEEVTGWRSFSRFILVQDTGGAITGPGRLDLFFGPGQDAEAKAGRMKEPGKLYFLVLKPGK